MAINWIQYPDYTSLSTGDKIIVSAPDGNTKKVPASAITSSVDTLQEITDNGNTTTNSINIGSSTSPAKKLTVTTSTIGDGILGISSDGYTWAQLQNDNSTTTPVGTLRLYYGTSQSVKLTALSSEMKLGDIQNKMTFFTASAERMRLTSDGKLGLGVTSPDVQFHASGDVKFTNAFVLDSIKHSGDSDTKIGFDTDTIKFDTNSSERMRLTSGGNLGVSTTNPSEKLSVTGGNIAVSNGGGLLVGGAVGDTKIGKLYNVSGVLSLDGDGDRNIRFGSTSNGEVMRVDNTNQRIGIGTTSPATNLQLGSFGNANQEFRIESDGNSYFSILTTNGVQKIYAGGAGTQSNEMAFYTSSSGTESERMRLTSAGRLGIGTTSPTVKLEVSSGGSDTPTIRASYNSTNYLELAHNKINAVSSGGNDSIRFQTAGTTKAYLDQNGNLGIATTSPNEKLHVVGDALITGDSHADAFKPAATGEPIKFKNFGSTELARITDGGNILLGTTTDSSHKLNVNGDINLPLNSNIRFGGQLALLKENNGEFNFYGGTNSTNGGFDFKTWTGSTYSTSFLIRNSGNVLIGTTTDGGEKLQVAGTASFVNTGNGQIDITRTSGATTFIQSQTATGVIGTSTNHKLDLKTNGSTRLRITNGGNVLIGTTTDSGNKLEVVGYVKASIGYKTGTYGLVYESSNELNIKNTAYYGINFHTNNAQRMKLTNAGNLLIGTTSDSGEKLVINGAVKIGSHLTLQQDGGNDQIKSTGSVLYVKANEYSFQDNSNNQRFKIATNGAATFYQSLTGTTANFSGNVSIGGTAGAVYKLDVVGKQRVQSVLELDDVLTLNAISTPADPASGKSSIYMDSADGAIKVKINVGGTVVTRTLASFE